MAHSPDVLDEDRGTSVTPSAQTIASLTAALARETDAHRRAECTARIQSNAVQLALDLLVSEPDVTGFFGAFMRSLVDECDSHACGVWLLDDEGTGCELWMAYTEGRLVTRTSADWEALKLPRESMTAHLLAHQPGWTETLEYSGDDPRLPEAVRDFNASLGVESLVVAPLMLPTRNLGWVALSTVHAPVCEGLWRRALVEAMSRQATLALHQSRLEEQRRQEERRQAVLEERNRIARDIHDTLAQGFAAILMQLQSVQRAAPALPAAAAASLESAVELARTHMIDARRSVCALRPQDSGDGDLAALLTRIADLARRTTDVPVDLVVDALPAVPAAIAHEIATIAQEALTNAIRHARARRIRVTAHAQRGVALFLSVADDGRGMAKERRGYGFGLTSMQERADRIRASLTIVTAPRSGTDVVLAWEPPSFEIPERDGAARS